MGIFLESNEKEKVEIGTIKIHGKDIEVPRNEIGDISDGYHTFNELYHHRALLFASVVNTNPEVAWKSKKHSDGTMYDDMFIVGITTPEGDATYHYDIEPYWDMFHCQERSNAPVFDGHTPEIAVERIYNYCTNKALHDVE